MASTALIPQNITEVMKLATMLAKSGMVPEVYQQNPENIVAAVQLGSELGIAPMTMLTNSYPVNNKIAIMTDLLMALCVKHRDFAGITVEKETETECSLTLRRRVDGEVIKVVSRFTMEDAVRAGLTARGQMYKLWPKRMLKHRALAFAIRDLFPDVAAGLYTYEEMVTQPAAEAITEAPEATTVAEEPLALSPPESENWLKLAEWAKQAKLSKKAMVELKARYKVVEGKRQEKLFMEKMSVELGVTKVEEPAHAQ